ncbi:MAG: hypothetical protein AAGK09_13495 [Planctomycetota bacterium]
MSALSKAFVVLVTFLSVVLVALVVPYVAQTEDLNGQIRALEGRAAAAEAKAASAQAEIAAIQADVATQVQRLQGVVGDLTKDLNAKDAQLSSVSQQLEGTRQDHASAKAALEAATISSQGSTELMKGMTEQLTDLRQRELQQARENIELTDALQERTAEVSALTRSLRQLREDLKSQTDRIGTLEETLASVPPDVVSTVLATDIDTKPVPSSPILGTVTAVSATGGETLVQISVGSNDGVADNMDFLVHSGDEYKGTVTITVVDSAEAAGTAVIAVGDIQPGDSVFAGEL